MKPIIYIISLALLISLSHLTAHAVTEKEMEQARTIATKAYLRYANDGSGYLDQITANTMAELEKKLKPKEKENLKAFKAIPVPSDYQSWDKQKLVEYWGVKAFNTPGLVDKGRIGRNRAKKNISAMTVTPPVKDTPKAQPESQPTPPATTPTAQKPTATPAATPAANQAATPVASSPTVTNDSTALEALAQAEAAADALSSLEDEPQIKKADNHTWIYIVILCVLVAVVCALVVFASNVMRKNESAVMKKASEKPDDPNSANAIHEQFTAALDSKNEEIAVLSKKIENLNEQNAALKVNLERLTTEAASLRSRLTDANRKMADMQNAANAAAANLVASVQQIPQQPAMSKPEAPTPPIQGLPQQTQRQATTANNLRTIYLGRANAKGIFVRADRTLNLGNSIFRLDTTDGYAGSFRVAADPTVWEMALLTPRESLSNACAIADIDNTAGMTKIINDSAGTAIFEGGCWKVIRKAKVHYE